MHMLPIFNHHEQNAVLVIMVAAKKIEQAAVGHTIVYIGQLILINTCTFVCANKPYMYMYVFLNRR